MPRHPPQEELRLIDHNIRNAPKPLVGWWCERCKRNFHHPAEPTPQCPYCYGEGITIKARRYF